MISTSWAVTASLCSHRPPKDETESLLMSNTKRFSVCSTHLNHLTPPAHPSSTPQELNIYFQEQGSQEPSFGKKLSAL